MTGRENQKKTVVWASQEREPGETNANVQEGSPSRGIGRENTRRQTWKKRNQDTPIKVGKEKKRKNGRKGYTKTDGGGETAYKPNGSSTDNSRTPYAQMTSLMDRRPGEGLRTLSWGPKGALQAHLSKKTKMIWGVLEIHLTLGREQMDTGRREDPTTT